MHLASVGAFCLSVALDAAGASVWAVCVVPADFLGTNQLLSKCKNRTTFFYSRVTYLLEGCSDHVRSYVRQIVTSP